MTKASAKPFPQRTNIANERRLELICPVNHPATLRAAVDNGADWIWLGHSEARSPAVPDLRLSRVALHKGIRYAHDRSCRVMLALTEAAPNPEWKAGTVAIDTAAAAGADALLLSDPALLLYAATRFPDIQLHYALRQMALSAGALDFLRRQFGISRIVLPPVLPLSLLEDLHPGPIGLAVSSHARFLMPVTRNCVAVERTPEIAPTDPSQLCGDSEHAVNDLCFDQHAASSFEALALLPHFLSLGIRAVVIHAPDQPPLRLAQVTQVWREAIDDCMEDAEHYTVKPGWLACLEQAA
jgi:putative protease